MLRASATSLVPTRGLTGPVRVKFDQMVEQTSVLESCNETVEHTFFVRKYGIHFRIIFSEFMFYI